MAVPIAEEVKRMAHLSGDGPSVGDVRGEVQAAERVLLDFDCLLHAPPAATSRLIQRLTDPRVGLAADARAAAEAYTATSDEVLQTQGATQRGHQLRYNLRASGHSPVSPLVRRLDAHLERHGAGIAVTAPDLPDLSTCAGHEDSPFMVIPRGLYAAAIAVVDGVPLLISAGWDGGVRTTRLTDGRPHPGARTGGRPGVLITHDGGVRALAVADVDGTPVVVTGGYDGHVRVTHVVDGAPHLGACHDGQPGLLTTHRGGVKAVAVADLDGTPVVVTGGGWDGQVRVTRLADGEPHRGTCHDGQPGLLTTHRSRIDALAVVDLDGTPVVIIGDGMYGKVWVIRLADGQPHPGVHHDGQPGLLTTHESSTWPMAVAVANLDGIPVVITGDGSNGKIRATRLVDGQPHPGVHHDGQPGLLTIHKNGVGAVAVADLGGIPVVITSGRWDREVRVARLIDGHPHPGVHHDGQPGLLTTHPRGVEAVAVADLDGFPLVITGSGQDREVRVTRLIDGQPHPGVHHDKKLGVLTTYNEGVSAVAVADVDGISVVITGGSGDGEVRVTRLIDGQPHPGVHHAGKLGLLTTHNEGVSAVAVANLDGTPVVITGGNDAEVRVTRLTDGQPHPGVHHKGKRGLLITPHEGVSAVAVANLDGLPLVISGGSPDGGVQVTRLRDGQPHPGVHLDGHLGWLSHHIHGVWAMTVADLDGTPMVIAGGGDGQIRITRIKDGRPHPRVHHDGKPGLLTTHEDGVGALGVAELDGMPLVITSGMLETVHASTLTGVSECLSLSSTSISSLALLVDGNSSVTIVRGTWAGEVLVLRCISYPEADGISPHS